MPVSAQTLWDWHSQPGTLQRLIPPWEAARVTDWLAPDGRKADGLLATGCRVDLMVRVGPLPMLWISQLEDVRPGQQFTDSQRHGPFASWRHLHRFVELKPGADGQPRCLLEDTVVYALPGGKLGELLGRGYIERRLQRTFDYRHKVTLESMRRRTWLGDAHAPVLTSARDGAHP